MIAAFLASRPPALRFGRDTTVDPAESTFAFDDYDIAANSTATATASGVARNAAGEPLAGKTIVDAYEAIAVSAANSVVTCTPSEAANDGVDTITLQVQVKDGSGRPIPDIPAADISFAASGTGNAIAALSGSTNQLGIITTTATSTVAEAKTYTATVRTVVITDTAAATFSGAPAAASFENLDAIAAITVAAEMKNPATINPTNFYVDNNDPIDQDPSDTGPGIGVGTRSRVTTGYTGTPAIGGAAVINGHFNAGDAGGSGQGRLQYNAANLTEMGVGIEHQWQVGYPFSDNSNKIWFTYWAGGERCFITTRVRADLGYSRCYRMAFDGGWPAPYGGLQVNGTIPLTEGAWEKLEWYIKKDTVSNTAGIIKLWVNGVLDIDLNDVVFPTSNACTTIYDEGENNGMYTQEHPTARYIGHSETDAGGSSGAPAADANDADGTRWLAVFKIYEPV